MDSINRKLSISEMAQIHDISRQTLIYYDKIGLFQPEIVDDNNGYRYYSTLQIPKLREICYLKSLGLPLDAIRLSNKSNNSANTIELLENQRDKITDDIKKMKFQLEQISKRVDIYRKATDFENDEYKPSIQFFPERKLVFSEWNRESHSRYELHYTLMHIWNITEEYGLLPSRRWGALFYRDNVLSGNPLKNAGGCCIVDGDIGDAPSLVTLKEGEYVCMPKYGMPYETRHISRLLEWIDKNGYEINGDIYDECIIDSIFYDDDEELDFCELQIPIRKKIF